MTYALLLRLINIEVENADGNIISPFHSISTYSSLILPSFLSLCYLLLFIGEGTLFRANSMAIGLFQVYSKIIGLRYIWNTLGGFITELNALSEQAAKHKGSGSSMSMKSSLVSDSFEMEVRRQIVYSSIYLYIYTSIHPWIHVSRSYPLFVILSFFLVRLIPIRWNRVKAQSTNTNCC